MPTVIIVKIILNDVISIPDHHRGLLLLTEAAAVSFLMATMSLVKTSANGKALGTRPNTSSLQFLAAIADRIPATPNPHVARNINNRSYRQACQQEAKLSPYWTATGVS